MFSVSFFIVIFVTLYLMDFGKAVNTMVVATNNNKKFFILNFIITINITPAKNPKIAALVLVNNNPLRDKNNTIT